jgi:hypothetical protein
MVMRNIDLAFVSLLFFSACNSRPQPETVSLAATDIEAKRIADLSRFFVRSGESYADAKQKITSIRNTLKQKYESADSDEKRQSVIEEARYEIIRSLVQEIIPYWYGTPWDFNGYTAEPGTGVVACGYFVSTTMQHAGFNLNRYTLAQQSPRDEASSINLSDSVPELNSPSIEEVHNYFQQFPDGLSFVGLDFHVGYLLKEKNQLYFIHSNYIEAEGVTIETIEKSDAFRSKWYFIAPITANSELVRKWILNSPIKTYKRPN